MPRDGFVEEAFRHWLARQRRGTDPDDPREQYHYRGAFAAGERPDASGHWSSRFKTFDSPERYVDPRGGYSSGKGRIMDSIDGKELVGLLRKAAAERIIKDHARRR